MKILVLTDRFGPEVTAPSVRIQDHAKVWLEHGHEVTVVTCVPNFPQGEVFDGYQNRIYQEEIVDGIRVLRVWSYIAPNRGFLRRTLDYVSYMISATLQCVRYPEFDVILATSPPLFTAVAGYLVGLLRRRPWVFEIRDLWPASIEAVGASTGGLMPLLKRLELFLYRKSDRIISLTNSFKSDLVERGIPGEKNDVITNSVDLARFNNDNVVPGARSLLGIDEEVFLAGYIGTIGMAHGLTIVLEAADLYREEPDVQFLLLGEGAERKGLEAEAKRLNLTNLHFRDFVPHEEMPSYFSALDASLVHLRPAPLFETVIPSKIFEAMAMGVPILMGVAGEAAEIVEAEGCGVCFKPGDPHSLVVAIESLIADKELRKRMSNRGREAAKTRYSRAPNAEAVIRSLEQAISDFNSRANHRRPGR